MRIKNRYYYLITFLALGTLFLAACGSQPGEAPDLQVDEQELGTRTITITATEFGFEPASIELNAGELVNIELVNKGVIEHEFQIEAFDFILSTMAGESAVAEFTPDKPGTFEFACHLPGHYEAGMVGEVEVAAE